MNQNKYDKQFEREYELWCKEFVPEMTEKDIDEEYKDWVKNHPIDKKGD